MDITRHLSSRRSYRTILLALLLITAGCSTPLSEKSSAESTPEVTPAPVPDDPPGADDIELNENNIPDSEQLAAAHKAALESAHVRNKTWVMFDDDHQLLTYKFQRMSDPRHVVEARSVNGTTTSILLTDHEEATSMEETRYTTRRSRGANRLIDGEERRMTWMEASQSFIDPIPPEDQRVVELLLSFATNASAAESDGASDWYLLTGRTSVPPDFLVAPWVTNPSNATVTALVTEEGFVRSVELDYDGQYEGRSVTVQYRVEYWLTEYHLDDWGTS